jgi:hypothetical protein
MLAIGDGEGALWAGLGGLVVAGGAFVLNYLTTRSKTRIEEEQSHNQVVSEKRRDMLTEAFQIIDVMKKDREEDRKTVHDLLNRLNDATLKMAICETERKEMEKDLAEQARQLRVLHDAVVRAGIVVDLRKPDGAKP